ncbi:trehalose-phosphatase [Tistrella bauzanensis]
MTPGLPELLQRLHGRFDGAVALVSGRTLGELDRLFHPAVLPAAGQHGLERRDHPPVSLARGFIEVGQVLERFVADTPGTLIERKSCGYAVHYRARPSAGPAVDRVARALATVTDPPLTVVPGKMVVEVRMPGADKGTAIRGFMQDAPFRGRIPVFIGDDVTDEDGFAMVNAFGGHSIRVGPPPPPATPGRPPRRPAGWSPMPGCSATGCTGWPSDREPLRQRDESRVGDLAARHRHRHPEPARSGTFGSVPRCGSKSENSGQKAPTGLGTWHRRWPGPEMQP